MCSYLCVDWGCQTISRWRIFRDRNVKVGGGAGLADADVAIEQAEAPGGRAPKRAEGLAAAAREFNAHGIGRASFSRIARDIGLTRAALYYYVKDRQDLVRQCYERTCEVMAGDLASAEAIKGDGLERLLGF